MKKLKVKIIESGSIPELEYKLNEALQQGYQVAEITNVSGEFYRSILGFLVKSETKRKLTKKKEYWLLSDQGWVIFDNRKKLVRTIKKFRSDLNEK
jgi:hypothetical protein